MKKHIELTQEQKLEALGLKYYSFIEWNPKKGDYYTTARPDLELYQIVDETETLFKTKYCHPSQGDEQAEWEKEKFLEDFGKVRVHVPDFILNG